MPKPTIPGKVRQDPAPRYNGDAPWDKVLNRDPERDYVYVNPNDDMFNPSYYQSLGYEVERKREGGPRAAVGKTASDGDLITVMDQVLMSCPMETRRQLDQHGIGGGGGQSYIDRIDAKILKPGGVDSLRGMDGYTTVLNETQKPTVER